MFHAAYVFDDVDDIYWAHERMLTEVINEYAPVKEPIFKAKKPDFMKDDLRQAMLFNKYKKCKTPLNWDNYRKERNLVKQIKKKSNVQLFLRTLCRKPKIQRFLAHYLAILVKEGL